MRNFFLLFLFIFAFADNNLTNILNNIPKSSQDYSYAKILVLKINSLKVQKFKCNCNEALKQNDFINKFMLLVGYRKKILDISKKISEIESKIEVLDDKPLSLLQKKFYKKEQIVLLNEKSYLQNHLPIWEKKLFNQLQYIQFDIDIANKNINYWNKLLIQKQSEFEKLNIDLQKWQLLNDQKNINIIKNYININLQKQTQIYKNLLQNSLIIWFYELQNKLKEVFNIQKLLNYSKQLGLENELRTEFINFEKMKFGSKYYLYNSKKEVENVFQKSIDLLNYPLFKINKKEITPIDLIIFLVILIFGWFIGKYYKKLIYSLRHKYDINYSTSTLLANMGYYFIITISFLIALKSIGLDLSSLAIVAGALSVGIGFGLQNIVSNFVSGIIMMFEKSIKVGDYIQIDNNTRGEVIDISMRSTVIKTNDNINLIIPNQTFIQNNVINWTMSDDLVRFRIPFGVAYGTNIEKMEEIILKAINNSNLPFIRSKNENFIPRIVFVEMGDSSLNFELFVWVKGKYARMPRRTRSKFLKIIYNTLNEAGISIPFPQQDLHIKDSVPFEIKIKKD